jgi:competence ComEA-like helix-hairpin-helix protein
MNVSPSYVAAVLVFFLGAAALFFRVREKVEDENFKSMTPLVCVGIQRPDGLFGFSIAPEKEVLDKAVSELLLPSDCADAAREKTLVAGTLLVFTRTPDGGCVPAFVKSLKGGARLAAGLRLNVNFEDKDGLMLLPGIGPKKAAALAASREREGLFLDAADLMRVWGIGPKTVQKLIPWLEFGQEPSRAK